MDKWHVYFPGRSMSSPNDPPTTPPATGGAPSGEPGPAPDSGSTDLSGRELTLQTPALGLSGRELTIQTPAPKPLTPELSGRELTMQTPAMGLSGRELTIQTATGKPPTADLSGRELTLQTPATGISGRELTLQTPTPVADLSGRELTMRGPGTPTPNTQVGGKPRTDHGFKPRTGVVTSISFDDAWHLQGRKGPFTGQTWGDFELGGILGEGGMGAVYRGKQKSLRRRVAIKVLPPNLAADGRLLQRFQLEATTASKLQTPHVVQVYSIGEFEGNHFYAMEYVEGKDLYDVIKERREANKPLTTDEAANYIMQAAKGLAEAGRQGVVHRDIKPPNLMVTKDGMVKIADFGIVKVLSEHNLTMTGQAVGTPAYVSPEQGRGDKEVDPRSDIYSLGVVFYELVCDKKPFDGSTPNALIYQHCYEEPKLPKEVNAAISDEIQAVVMRCLQKKPENRYQSADELVRDLEAIRAGSMLKSAIANYKLGTGADEAKREQMTWLQRNMLPVAAAALLVFGGIGYGIYSYNEKLRKAESIAELKRKDDEIEAKEKKLMNESKITGLRNTLKASLDIPGALPEAVEASLTSLAKLTTDGDKDNDVVRWRAKVTAVRDLELKLSPIEAGTPTVEQRKAARKDLEAYIGKVGGTEAKAARWTARLNGIDEEEQRLRTECAKLDTTLLKKSSRDQYVPLIESLAALTPADDPQLVKWKQKLATFDQTLNALLEQIKPLETEASVTVAKRQLYQPIVNDLAIYLDVGDKKLEAWNTKLSSVGQRMSDYQTKIKGIVGDQPERISKPDFDRIKETLASYESLVGSENPQLKDWKAAITNGENAIVGIRGRLKDFVDKSGDDKVLPQGVHAVFASQLKELKSLIYSGDQDVQKWEETLRDSIATLKALENDCSVLAVTAENPVTMAAQLDLAPKVGRLLAKGAINADRADAYRQRLTTEARRIKILRDSLVAFNQAESISDSMVKGLERLTTDAGTDDADVKRWSAKHARVLALQEKLSALDRRAGVPDEVGKLFDELKQLVGEKDSQLVAWQGKVQRIDSARKSLTVLDPKRRVAFNADEMAVKLRDLEELVGSGDRQLLTWKAKAAEVALHKSELAKLATTIAQSVEANGVAHARLHHLIVDMIGADDDDIRAAAKRLDELDGPPQPAWAKAGKMGRDRDGMWAEADLPGGSQRFRYVASGTFTIGSPDTEASREADELQVQLTLPRGFWIAEVELPRANWLAHMSGDPSRSASMDAALQPVERMTWAEAQDYCSKLNAAVPGLSARLPLEAEWEYACRAGTSEAWNRPADVAADADGVAKIAWCDANAAGGPHASRGRLPNALGLFDMHGNLAEWCADAYTPYPTAPTEITSPASGGDRRVLRGGSWGDSWTRTRAANRIPARADLRSAFVGMRLALDVEWGARAPDGTQLIAQAQRAAGGRQFSFPVGGWRVQIQQETAAQAGAVKR